MSATMDESVGHRVEEHSPERGLWDRVSPPIHTIPWPICVVTLVAAVLRFVSLEDKPPLDLWLQVASVKLFGWSQFGLKLPEALAGTLSVPLLYDAVRRAVNRPAGLGAGVALALLPESVLTARSDTMDSVMMLLVIGALWLTVHATGSSARPRRDIVLAGVALGLAVNVKLLEALIAAPAIVVFLLLAAPRARARAAMIRDIAFCGAAAIGVTDTVGLTGAARLYLLSPDRAG